MPALAIINIIGNMTQVFNTVLISFIMVQSDSAISPLSLYPSSVILSFSFCYTLCNNSSYIHIESVCGYVCVSCSAVFCGYPSASDYADHVVEFSACVPTQTSKADCTSHCCFSSYLFIQQAVSCPMSYIMSWNELISLCKYTANISGKSTFCTGGEGNVAAPPN